MSVLLVAVEVLPLVEAMNYLVKNPPDSCPAFMGFGQSSLLS